MAGHSTETTLSAAVDNDTIKVNSSGKLYSVSTSDFVFVDTYRDLPSKGDESVIYVVKDEDQLYYWKLFTADEDDGIHSPGETWYDYALLSDTDFSTKISQAVESHVYYPLLGMDNKSEPTVLLDSNKIDSFADQVLTAYFDRANEVGSNIGIASLQIGNSLSEDATGHTYGRIRIGNGRGSYCEITGNNQKTSNTQLRLESASGVIPVVSGALTKYDSSTPVYVDEDYTLQPLQSIEKTYSSPSDFWSAARNVYLASTALTKIGSLVLLRGDFIADSDEYGVTEYDLGTLNEGFRPTSTIVYYWNRNDTQNSIMIRPEGLITVYFSNSNTWWDVDEVICSIDVVYATALT